MKAKINTGSFLEIVFSVGKKEDVILYLGSFKDKEKLINNSKPDIVLETKTDFSLKTLPQETIFISSDGEYEIKKVFVWAYSFLKEKEKRNFFVAEGEEITISYFDSPFNLEEFKKELEEIGQIDIVFFFPSDYSFNVKEAKKTIFDLEPKMIVANNFDDQKKMNDFLKEMGIKKIEKLNKISLKKKDLIFDGKKIIILER
jgi:hypothetical protein